VQKAENDLDLGSGNVKDVEDLGILLELVKMLLTQFLMKMSIGVQKMLERQMLNPLMFRFHRPERGIRPRLFQSNIL